MFASSSSRKLQEPGRCDHRRALPSSRTKLWRSLFAFALVFGLLACSKADGLPKEPATPGAIIAARESATGRYRLYRVVSAEPLPDPLGPKLRLVAFDETTADFKEARQLAKHAALHPIYDNVVVLGRDFFKREHQVVGFQPLQPGEAPPSDESSRQLLTR